MSLSHQAAEIITDTPPALLAHTCARKVRIRTPSEDHRDDEPTLGFEVFRKDLRSWLRHSEGRRSQLSVMGMCKSPSSQKHTN